MRGFFTETTMSSTSHNNLNVDDIERELENSDEEFDNYDSDPEFLISDGESDSNDEEIIADDEPATNFLEEDWSNTTLNLGRVDFTGRSAGLIQ